MHDAPLAAADAWRAAGTSFALVQERKQILSDPRRMLEEGPHGYVPLTPKLLFLETPKMGTGARIHPGGNPGASLESISHICHPILVAFAWELTEETFKLPLGCLQGGSLNRKLWHPVDQFIPDAVFQ